MRPTLFLILLLSVLGGYNVSAAHTIVAPKVFFQQGKQQILSPHSASTLSLVSSINVGEWAADAVTGDMEDDGNEDELHSRKNRVPAGGIPISSHVIILSRLHRYSLHTSVDDSMSSRKFITLRTLRI